MDQFETQLSPSDEARFQTWKSRYAPNDTGSDYDLRGAYKAGLTPDPTSGHWPDTFKKPNHPTFSVESQYAAQAPGKAGSWDGDTYKMPDQLGPLNDFANLGFAPGMRPPGITYPSGTPSSLGEVLGQILTYTGAAIPGPGQLLGAAGLIDSLPGSPTNLVGNSDAKLGMIPTVDNLDRFESMKGAIKSQLLKQGYSPEGAEAMSFMGARYPQRMSNNINAITENSSLPDDVAGQVSTLPAKGQNPVTYALKRGITKMIGGTPSAPEPSSFTIDLNPNGATPTDLTSTLAHETQHALDVNRNGALSVSQPMTRGVQGAMESAGLGDAFPYTSIPSEARAYKAGDTAAAAYQKYLKLNPSAGAIEKPTLDRWGTPRIQIVDEHGAPVMLK